MEQIAVSVHGVMQPPNFHTVLESVPAASIGECEIFTVLQPWYCQNAVTYRVQTGCKK